MRSLLALSLFLIASSASGAVTFVAPLEGSQPVGPSAIEVTSDAAKIDRVEFFVDGVLAGVARQQPYRIGFDFGTSLAQRVVTAKVWSDGFRRTESASVTTARLTANDVLDVDLVEVPLRVRSTKTLQAADLRVRENGVVQQVRDVKRERPAAHFAVIVDRSLSMNDGKLEAALQAVQTELRQLRDGDTASLVVFNHNVAKPRPIARGATLHDATLAPSGGTSLRDALASVASKERTYAIVITDGGDRNSVLSDEEALRRISGTRTIVNAIVLGTSHARFLDRAASNTGGSVVAASSATVGETLSRLLADINGRYLVIYQSKGTKRGWRSVEVKPLRRGVEIVNARKGYFAE
ncbi:MAG TPA: VWA-like domain-containing protein [Thermoanaerobaculia bacterium]|nr:VWA-like domain-containing protein [Thermoanaerobaculia bacterium]